MNISISSPCNHYTPRFKSCMFLVLSSEETKAQKLLLDLLLSEHIIFLNGEFCYAEFSSTFHDNNIIKINDQCDICFEGTNDDFYEDWELFTIKKIIK